MVVNLSFSDNVVINTEESFSEKLEICSNVHKDKFFKTQKTQLLDPTDKDTYTELQSNYRSQYHPQLNETLFTNPYTPEMIVVRKYTLEQFVAIRRKYILREFVISYLVRETMKSRHLQQFFLTPYDPLGEKRYVFLYNKRKEMVVIAKVDYSYNPRQQRRDCDYSTSWKK